MGADAKFPDINNDERGRTTRSARSSLGGQSPLTLDSADRRVGSGSKRRDDDVRRLNSYTGIRALFNPLWCYHGFIAVVMVLTGIGAVMVFSSSTVSMVSQGKSPFDKAATQMLFCVIGIVVGGLLMIVPMRVYRKISVIIVGAAMGLQLLTFTPLGVDVNGNRGWINIGFTVQPAEVTKLALCIWLPSAMIAARKRYASVGFIKAYGPALLVFALSAALVLGGKDLGTTLIIFLIGFVAFLLGGFPGKILSIATAVLAVAIGIGVSLSPNRLGRVLATYQECTGTQMQGVCYQSIHAKYALAEGGLFGVGIGNSREKWNYLPEAHNDFIFAIIGEELGFVGAFAVILLFVVLGWCMICIALRTRDSYVSVSLLCIAVWIVGQALINIGVVVKVFPVMGVPMPFVSAGGSSLVMCMAAAGVAASLMRAQPEIKADTSRA